jgi:hypothetical protein
MQHGERRSGKTRAGTRLAALAVALVACGLVAGSASARVPAPGSARATGSPASAIRHTVPLAPAHHVPVCTATTTGGVQTAVRRVSIAGPAIENTSPFATVGIGGHSL